MSWVLLSWNLHILRIELIMETSRQKSWVMALAIIAEIRFIIIIVMAKVTFIKEKRNIRFDNPDAIQKFIFTIDEWNSVIEKKPSNGVFNVLRPRHRFIYTIKDGQILTCALIQHKNKMFKICYEMADNTIERLELSVGSETVFFTSKKEVIEDIARRSKESVCETVRRGAEALKQAAKEYKDSATETIERVAKKTGTEEPGTLKGACTIAAELLKEISDTIENKWVGDGPEDEDIINLRVKRSDLKNMRLSLKKLQHNFQENLTEIEEMTKRIKNFLY